MRTVPRRPRAVAVLLSALGLGTATAGCGRAAGEDENAATTDEVRAGSYRLRICRGSCSGPGLLVRGYLVLDEPVERGTGCFSLERMRGDADVHAGIQPAGTLRWEPAPGAPLRVDLYRSPDASYQAELLPTRDGLRGTGRSAGFGYPNTQAPLDSVVAERFGEPDPRWCAPPADIRRPGPPLTP